MQLGQPFIIVAICVLLAQIVLTAHRFTFHLHGTPTCSYLFTHTHTHTHAHYFHHKTVCCGTPPLCSYVPLPYVATYPPPLPYVAMFPSLMLLCIPFVSLLLRTPPLCYYIPSLLLLGTLHTCTPPLCCYVHLSYVAMYPSLILLCAPP